MSVFNRILQKQKNMTDIEDKTDNSLVDLNDKDILKLTIQKWVANDNEMRLLNDEITKKKKLNKEYTQELLNLIKNLDIETVDINNGYISYVKRNQRKPITNKLLTDIFTKYYNGNLEEVERINNFIKDNREISTKETIVRKIL
jgi:hypothetical protein